MIAFLISFCFGVAFGCVLFVYFVRHWERRRRVCALCKGKSQSEDGIPCPICSRRAWR